MLEIEWAGERLLLLPEKAIFWRRTETLIVVDLHLGKPAAFRAAGIAVPESTTAGDLKRLEKIIRETGSRRLIVLGDLFHARSGLQREMLNAVADWRQRHDALEIVLIPGNHDKHAGSPPEAWRMCGVAELWKCEPFWFAHEPRELAAGHLMAGHLHPAISLRETYGGGVRTACFYFGERTAVLPAFGSFTGMSNVEPKRGDRIFAIDTREGAVVELVGGKNPRR